jgi:hypothetical protein
MTPESTTLEPLVGKPVVLEGKVTMQKAGYVLETSGLPIILEYRGAQNATWPTPGTRVQVTGTLRAAEGARSEYRYHLEHPQSRIVADPTR